MNRVCHCYSQKWFHAHARNAVPHSVHTNVSGDFSAQYQAMPELMTARATMIKNKLKADRFIVPLRRACMTERVRQT
jgi:hypothetical protein